MIFRLYHELRGGHVHCRLYAGGHDGALGKCGEFIMQAGEFAHFGWLCRERLQFVPPLTYPPAMSDYAKETATRILESARLGLTVAEHEAAIAELAAALDHVFELGIKSAGGSVIDLQKREDYHG